jgi:chloramphenicol 3-O-phosphotransferase
MSQIVIVSGPPGAGKSSVCESLCERYDRTVHLQTDDAYAWIRMGFVPPWKPGSQRQNETVSRACARAATAFAQQQYGVFIDGVIGAHILPLYLEELGVARVRVHYVVLLPSVGAMRERAAAREKQLGRVGDMYERMHAMFADAERGPGCVIDSSRMTADQTADAVMAACGRGEALVSAG